MPFQISTSKPETQPSGSWTAANAARLAKRQARARQRVAIREDGTATVEVTGSDRPAIIDAADVELVGRHSQRLDSKGYPRTKRDGRAIPLHELLLGKAPPGMVTDHINGDKLDNRRANLRHVTPAQNAQNRKRRSDSAIGLKGVRLNRRTGKHEARIGHRGRHEYLGTFDTAGSAMLAYDEAMRLFHSTGRSSFQEAIHELRALAVHLDANPDDAEARAKFDRLKALLTTFDANPTRPRCLGAPATNVDPRLSDPPWVVRVWPPKETDEPPKVLPHEATAEVTQGTPDAA